jgi:glutathione S-transferase
MAAIVRKLRQLLAEQNERGRTYLVGNTLSAIDIYWAIFAGAIRPLPASLCPGMPDGMRANYTNPELEEEAGPALMSHRDFVYQTHLKLPMDFA